MKFGFGSHNTNYQRITSDVNAINTHSQDQDKDKERVKESDTDRFFDETKGKPSLRDALSGVDGHVLIDDRTHVNLDLLSDELLLTEFSN